MYKSIFRRNVYSSVYFSHEGYMNYRGEYISYWCDNPTLFKSNHLSKIVSIDNIIELSFVLKVGDKYKHERFGDKELEIIDIIYEDDVIVYILEDGFIEDDYTQESYDKALKQIEKHKKEQAEKEKRKQERKEKVIQEYNTKSWIYRKLHKLEDYLKENKEKWSQ